MCVCCIKVISQDNDRVSWVLNVSTLWVIDDEVDTCVVGIDRVQWGLVVEVTSPWDIVVDHVTSSYKCGLVDR